MEKKLDTNKESPWSTISMFILTEDKNCHADLLTNAPDPIYWHSEQIKYLESVQAELNRWPKDTFLQINANKHSSRIPIIYCDRLGALIDVPIINALRSIFPNMAHGPFPVIFVFMFHRTLDSIMNL